MLTGSACQGEAKQLDKWHIYLSYFSCCHLIAHRSVVSQTAFSCRTRTSISSSDCVSTCKTSVSSLISYTSVAHPKCCKILTKHPKCNQIDALCGHSHGNLMTIRLSELHFPEKKKTSRSVKFEPNTIGGSISTQGFIHTVGLNRPTSLYIQCMHLPH